MIKITIPRLHKNVDTIEDLRIFMKSRGLIRVMWGNACSDLENYIKTGHWTCPILDYSNELNHRAIFFNDDISKELLTELVLKFG